MNYCENTGLSVVCAADTELLLKLRQISFKMRWFVAQILKDKKIKGKLSKEILKLNGHIHSSENIDNPDKYCRGIANYLIQTQKELNHLKDVSFKLYCSLSLVSKVHRNTFFEKIDEMKVNSSNWMFYETLSFNQVNRAVFEDLEESQIEAVLRKIKQISSIVFKNSSICTDSLLNYSFIDLVKFENCVIEEVFLNSINTVIFTKNTLKGAVECNKIDNLVINRQKQSKFLTELVQKLSSLHKIELNSSELEENSLLHLRNSIRNIKCSNTSKKSFNIQANLSKFPLLIGFNYPSKTIKGSTATKLRLRELSCGLEDDLEGNTCETLKRVVVTDENVIVFNNHPEMLKNCTDLEICSVYFNFDCMANEMKKLKIVFDCDAEGVDLSRIKAKFG